LIVIANSTFLHEGILSTEARSRESGYSQALNQNKIDGQMPWPRSRESTGGQTVRRLGWIVFRVELAKERRRICDEDGMFVYRL